MSVKILSITLLLILVCLAFHPTAGRTPGRIIPCCPDVTVANKTHEVTGNTYRLQNPRPGCVKAVIFNTGHGGKLCASPDEPWVKNLIRNMTKNP
ncbi:C-C motif chemokine 19-like [Mugil cephalus]|uniref:C-C motif chemokine 19-like n=1 Tax=Mugil cephalus TaxID=48193 RepID=UPI001FB712F6|nr:C-C motif chemokine 19-like [Mugil cephalus]